MTTALSSPPPAKAAKTTRASAARTTTAAAEPSLRFHYSKVLQKRSNAVLSALEAAPEKAQHADALADLVAELVEAGMEYYFLRPLAEADLGFIKEQSARLGISGAVRLINSVSRKFIIRMDSAQLLAVAAHMRSLA